MKRILHRRKRNEPRRKRKSELFQNSRESRKENPRCRCVVSSSARKFSDLKSSPIMMPVALTEYFTILSDVFADQCQSSTPIVSWQKNSAATDIFLDESVSCTRQPSLLPFVSTESCGVYKGSLVSISRLVSSANDEFPPFPSSSLSPWKAPRIYATSS